MIAYVVLIVITMFWSGLYDYKLLLLIQSMPVLFTTLGTDWLNSIHEDYLYITERYLICHTISLLLMFLLVKSPNDYLLYALTSVCASVIANILNMIYVRKKYSIRPKITFHCDLKKHLKPIFILFFTSISTFIYVNSDITILGILKDESEVGIYSLSVKIYSIVKQVLNALLIVAIPRVGYEIGARSKEDVKNRLEDLLGEVVVLICPACVGLFMLSKQVVTIVSGVEYISAVPSLEILSLALFFATLVTFYVYVVMIPYNKEKYVLYITVVSAIVNILLNFILIPIFGGIAAAFTTLISEALSAVFGMICTLKIIKIIIRKPIYAGGLSAITTFIICYIIKNMNFSDIFTIVIAVVFSVLSWILICSFFYSDRVMIIINKMKNK